MFAILCDVDWEVKIVAGSKDKGDDGGGGGDDIDDDGAMVLPLHIIFNNVRTLVLTPLQPTLFITPRY